MVEGAYITHSDVEVNARTGVVLCWAFVITYNEIQGPGFDEVRDAVRLVAPTCKVRELTWGATQLTVFDAAEAAAIKLAFPYNQFMF